MKKQNLSLSIGLKIDIILSFAKAKNEGYSARQNNFLI